jgi:hypothetical protein
MRGMGLTVLFLMLTACVRVEDTAAWVGQPVAQLDLHPFFNTLPVEVRRAADGTEIRNYVNGGNVASCFQNATVTGFSTNAVYGSGSGFCSTRFQACNNIFYIRDGRVIRYVPTGSGGAICYTAPFLQPQNI